jgi:hypothetical protein
LANVSISHHAASLFDARGTNAEEVTQAVNQSSWVAAGRGRLDCRKDFEFGGEWQGVRYGWKQVRPVFIEDFDGVVVVTVYTYFSQS